MKKVDRLKHGIILGYSDDVLRYKMFGGASEEETIEGIADRLIISSKLGRNIGDIMIPLIGIIALVAEKDSATYMAFKEILKDVKEARNDSIGIDLDNLCNSKD